MTPPPRRARSSGADLSADLLADLTAPGPLPSAPVTPPPSTTPTLGGTPALSVTLTPLRWRAPSLAPAERGVGMAVRLGPLRVEVAF
jgi:hypothetical protein